MDRIWARLEEIFSAEHVAQLLADALPKLVVALIYFFAFLLLWQMLRRAARLLMQRLSFDETLRAFVQTMLKAILLTVGAVAAIGELGVDTTSLVASLGVAGLTIGFAARDVLSNVISGLFIFWDRPFTVNDLVEIDGKYGRVEQITLRTTRVVTPDGRMLAVPNSQIVNSVVASYTNFPHLRLEIDVTIAVDQDLDRARAVVLELVQGDPRFLPDPAPVVVMTAINDYNVAMQLRAWLDDERQHIDERFELRERVFRALTEAGIDMPFETFRVEPVTVRSAA